MSENPPHFRAARVHISPIRGQKDRETGAITPVVDVLLITENGEIWKRIMMAYSVSKEVVFDEWDKNPERFIKHTQPFGTNS